MNTIRFAVGQVVVTTNDSGSKDWSPDTRKDVRWGILGHVSAVHDSHGLCYRVEHGDGTYSYYEHEELRPWDSARSDQDQEVALPNQRELTNTVLDPALVCQSLGILNTSEIPKAVIQRARKRYPREQEYVTVSESAAQLTRPVAERKISWLPILVIECWMGFDPSREPGRGYEPCYPPEGYSDNPLGYTSDTIDRLIDLACHPDGPGCVAARMISDILLATRKTIRTRVKKNADVTYYPAESDIARARRIADLIAIPKNGA